jgi:hypothetical protein
MILLSLSTVDSVLVLPYHSGSSICTYLPLLWLFLSFGFSGFLPLLATQITFFIDQNKKSVKFCRKRREQAASRVVHSILLVGLSASVAAVKVSHLDYFPRILHKLTNNSSRFRRFFSWRQRLQICGLRY